MKKNSIRVMIAVALSVFALALASPRPSAACGVGSCGGIGGVFRMSPTTFSR